MSEDTENASAPPPTTPARRMGKTARVVGISAIVVGGIFAVAGTVTYVLVQQTLADQRITVSDDASMFAGDAVAGPFTAYAQAMVIGKHAQEIAGGKTYAELPKDDPNRDTVMTASFLQASLFTSVVAFGVAALVIVLGILLAFVGWAMFRMGHEIASLQASST